VTSAGRTSSEATGAGSATGGAVTVTRTSPRSAPLAAKITFFAPLSLGHPLSVTAHPRITRRAVHTITITGFQDLTYAVTVIQ
jgi:hypothetical protein